MGVGSLSALGNKIELRQSMWFISKDLWYFLMTCHMSVSVVDRKSIRHTMILTMG